MQKIQTTRQFLLLRNISLSAEIMLIIFDSFSKGIRSFRSNPVKILTPFPITGVLAGMGLLIDSFSMGLLLWQGSKYERLD